MSILNTSYGTIDREQYGNLGSLNFKKFKKFANPINSLKRQMILTNPMLAQQMHHRKKMAKGIFTLRGIDAEETGLGKLRLKKLLNPVEHTKRTVKLAKTKGFKKVAGAVAIAAATYYTGGAASGALKAAKAAKMAKTASTANKAYKVAKMANSASKYIPKRKGGTVAAENSVAYQQDIQQDTQQGTMSPAAQQAFTKEYQQASPAKKAKMAKMVAGKKGKSGKRGKTNALLLVGAGAGAYALSKKSSGKNTSGERDVISAGGAPFAVADKSDYSGNMFRSKTSNTSDFNPSRFKTGVDAESSGDEGDDYAGSGASNMPDSKTLTTGGLILLAAVGGYLLTNKKRGR